MTITLDSETEAKMRFLAEREHLPLEEWLAQLVERGAQAESAKVQPPGPEGKRRYRNLHELLVHSPLRGADLDLKREKDFSPLDRA